MRKQILPATLTVALPGYASANEDDDSSSNGDDQVFTTNVLGVLEEINEKIESVSPTMSHEGAPDEGCGGRPFWLLRYMPGIADINTYFDGIGSYGDLRLFFYPLKDGGAGRWRWSVDEPFQVGVEYGAWGSRPWGQSPTRPIR